MSELNYLQAKKDFQAKYKTLKDSQDKAVITIARQVQTIAELKEQKEELVEVLDTFMKYYETDFFIFHAVEGRVKSEWVSKAMKALKNAKNLNN